MTLFDSALHRAADDPDGVALWLRAGGQTTTLTHSSLIDGARRYAAMLSRHGVRPGDVVIVLLDHSVDQYWSFLGAMLVGGIPSFMPPLSSKQHPSLYWSAHATLFDRIKPAVIVTDARRAGQLREHLPTLPAAVVTPQDVPENASDIALPSISDDAVALLQHSSGTTQTKKGVELTHRAIRAQVDAYAATLGLTEADRIASWLPLYHDMGLIACFMLPLIKGIPVVALDPFDWVVAPDLLLDAIATHRCTLTWMPNFAFNHLARLRRPDRRHRLDTMRAWIDCSEPCRTATFDLFASTFADCGVRPEHLQVCYAMAETVFAVSQTPLGRPATRHKASGGAEFLSAGQVLPGLAVTIRDATGRPVPDGQTGEISVSGEFLFNGYYRLPDVTSQKLSGGIYRTGDLGFLWQGDLYVTGRLDDLIIVNGRNFYAHEIEHVTGQISGVKPGRVSAFAIDDPVGGSQAAVVVAEVETPEATGSQRLKREIREAVLSQCDLTLRDVVLAEAGWIVKTTSGKVSRVENQNKYLADRP